MILWLLALAVAIAILVKSADIFTDRSERVGLALGIPQFVVGILIVGIGTSIPELATSLYAAAQGQPDIVIGNVLGSNITNLLLVLGMAALITRGIQIKWEIIRVDLPLLIGSTLFIALCLLDGVFTATEGVLALMGYGVYLWYSLSRHTHLFIEEERRTRTTSSDWTLLIASIAGIYIGARLAIVSLTELSTLLSIAPGLLAISLLAIGTSLPEVVVSIRASQRGKEELAIGNILGSNVFNSFVVLGLPSLLTPLTASANVLLYGLLFLFASTILFLVIIQDKEITLWDGMMLLLLFALFITKIGGAIL
ncbi:MAG: calcium/sodium antiporter [Nitrosarchaeum sp.]|nr:calcium/sodium antiporter [Nitrosarchaeum sp.]